MMEYISGKAGIGKSKVLLETAVATASISKGNVVFIGIEDKYHTVIPQSVRMINVGDYSINSASSLFGFLAGLCANDYDLTDIFVDADVTDIALKTSNSDDFFEIANSYSNRLGVDFHFAISDKYGEELEYFKPAI